MKKMAAVAAMAAVTVAGTVFAAESITVSRTTHGDGTRVQAVEKVSVHGGTLRVERNELVVAGGGKGNKRLICKEEAGRYGKIAIREIAADGRKAQVEGVYMRY